MFRLVVSCSAGALAARANLNIERVPERSDAPPPFPQTQASAELYLKPDRLRSALILFATMFHHFRGYPSLTCWAAPD